MCRLDLGTIIAVVIVRHVKGFVNFCKGRDTDGFGEEKVGLYVSEVCSGVLRVDDLRGKGKSDKRIRSQAVFFVYYLSSAYVPIDSPQSDVC